MPAFCSPPLRVIIDLSTNEKHTLPVDSNCSYSHPKGIDTVGKGGEKDACKFANGTRVQNHSDLSQCMKKAGCPFTDDALQMAIFRDPRPIAVSAYYHLKTHGRRNLGNLEAYVAEELPLTCQWMALRHILFDGLLSQQSEAFWYEDALANPLAWHYRWFDFVGVQLPAYEMNATATAAVNNDFSFEYKHIDVHSDQVPQTKTKVRRFEDEVSPETLKVADAVLRKWLPPVLLAKLGV